MPLLRNSLLSHLSPSLLTKMSLAVLATFSPSLYAAPNPNGVTSIVNLAKTSNVIATADLYASQTSPLENYAVTSALYALMSTTSLVFERAIVNLPTTEEAQAAAAANLAVTGATQMVTIIQMRPVGAIDALVLTTANGVAANAANQAYRAFADLATDVKSPGSSDEITIRAEQMTGRPARVLNFDGQVEIVRGPATIDAETAEYHGIEDLVMANRHVQMFRNRDCYSGDTLEMQMDTGEGFLINPVYKLERNNAQGFARRMNFIDNDRSEIEDGMYTTCEGTRPDWYMLSSRMDLDAGRDEGVAYGGVVYFQNVPILASPWMSFPISDARRSGVLPPEFYTTTVGGPEIAIPYYFDVAPNRDITVIPKIIEKRGEQLGAEFRYLGADYNGISHLEFIPDDHDYRNEKRYSVGVIYNQVWPASGLTMNVNYNRASDNQYAIDFSHSITASSQHLLPQTFQLVENTGVWTAGMYIGRYQVLQDVNNDIGPQYEISPRLFISESKVNDFGGFDWSAYGEYTNFLHPTSVNGERLVFQGQVSYPITGTYFFVTPKVLYHLSDYALGANLSAFQSYIDMPNSPANPSLSVPTFSLDSGLYFERETDFFGRNITQTLEPRLFYVRTPYRSQTDIPIFDTGISDINFAQIFTENRFTGQDRVSDANQLTAALITRAIEMDGQERIRFAIAQRSSFQQPLVVDYPSYDSTSVSGNSTIYTQHSTLPSKSDLIFAASGKLTDTLSMDAGWQYSESFKNTQQLNYGFKWQPGPMQVVNAEYRFQNISEVDPEGMKQIDISAQWPLAPRWYGVARTNFSLQDHRVLDGLAGLEYKQDCWVFRFVAQRYLVPSTVAGVTSSSTTSLFFQLELNGLSKIGSNPLEVLKRNISGYQPVNQPTTQQSYQQSNF